MLVRRLAAALGVEVPVADRVAVTVPGVGLYGAAPGGGVPRALVGVDGGLLVATTAVEPARIVDAYRAGHRSRSGPVPSPAPGPGPGGPGGPGPVRGSPVEPAGTTQDSRTGSGPPPGDGPGGDRGLLGRWLPAGLRTGGAPAVTAVGDGATLPVWASVLRWFLVIGWLRAVAAKLVAGRAWFDGTGVIEHVATWGGHAPWFGSPVVRIVGGNRPVAVVVAVVVLAVEAALVWAAASRHRTGLAAGLAGGLCVAIILSGRTDPAVFYLLAHTALWMRSVEAVPAVLRPRRLLGALTVVSGVLAVLSMTAIRDLHPDRVVADPGAVLTTVAALVGVGLWLLTPAGGPRVRLSTDPDA